MFGVNDYYLVLFYNISNNNKYKILIFTIILKIKRNKGEDLIKKIFFCIYLNDQVNKLNRLKPFRITIVWIDYSAFWLSSCASLWGPPCAVLRLFANIIVFISQNYIHF